MRSYQTHVTLLILIALCLGGCGWGQNSCNNPYGCGCGNNQYAAPNNGGYYNPQNNSGVAPGGAMPGYRNLPTGSSPSIGMPPNGP